MIPLFPEIFLGTSILFLLVCGSVLGFSSKYNYPTICFQYLTLLILFWSFILCNNNVCTLITPYFIHDSLSTNSKALMILGLFGSVCVGQTRQIKIFEFYVLILISLLGLSFLAASLDLLSVYLCLELITLSFYILAAFQRSSAFSTEAGLKYFLLGAISSSFLLFGISFVYGFSGTTNLIHLTYLYINLNNELLSGLIQFGLFFYCAGLLFKLGCVPFHMWVPDVYEGSPTYVSVIFSVVPKISIFAVLIRLIKACPPNIWSTLLLSVAFISLLAGSLYALSQVKIKRLLAFSGISHVGYGLVGLSINSIESIQSSIFYIIIYMCTALFLWGLSLAVENKNGRTLYLTDLLQWGKTNKALSLSSVFVIFSLAGIPPLGGFFAKFAVFVTCAKSSFFLGLIVGLLTSAIGIVYYLRIIKLIYFEEGEWSRPVPLRKIHALIIGLAGFFLIFFVFFSDFIFLLTATISC
jgi:NADH-quinone oxidoreductase subunit N